MRLAPKAGPFARGRKSPPKTCRCSTVLSGAPVLGAFQPTRRQWRPRRYSPLTAQAASRPASLRFDSGTRPQSDQLRTAEGAAGRLATSPPRRLLIEQLARALGVTQRLSPHRQQGLVAT